MPDLVQVLQIVSGVAWLCVALFLAPRLARAWRKDASRATMLAAPIGLLAWMQFGFVVRWQVWPHAMVVMSAPELTTWAALYALSVVLAGWTLVGAIQTRND